MEDQPNGLVAVFVSWSGYALGAVLLCWILRRWGRGPLAALLFFIGTLFPALGFLNVFPFQKCSLRRGPFSVKSQVAVRSWRPPLESTHSSGGFRDRED